MTYKAKVECNRQNIKQLGHLYQPPKLEVFKIYQSPRIAQVMESPLDQIRDLYAQADASERHRLQNQLRDLQNELYTEWDIMFGMAMGVSMNPIILLKRYS